MVVSGRSSPWPLTWREASPAAGGGPRTRGVSLGERNHDHPWVIALVKLVRPPMLICEPVPPPWRTSSVGSWRTPSGSIGPPRRSS
jgi:hypothetical protein